MRKKVLTFLVTAVMLVALLPVSVFAASASAWFNGPGTVRAGDTINLEFVLSGSNLLGASGTLSYDGSQLTLVKTAQSIGGSWLVEFNGNNFAAYDNNLTSPINGNAKLFTATFRVNNVPEGSVISVSCQNVKATDGSADANVGTVTHSISVAAPLSSDNVLGSMTVSNASISPAFSPDVTSYSAQVPYEVSQLQISAKARHDKAKVSVKNPQLTPNTTTNVSVTVTAENGATKTYTISVKRAQDPNYVPSNNSKLSGITVEGFLLSPGFDQNITQYVIWLPYEVDSVVVGGAAEHPLASVRVEGGSNLIAGADNEVKVIGVAEDGTETVYTVIAKRGPAHDAQPEETEPTTVPTETTESTTAPTEPVDSEAGNGQGGVTVLLIVLAFVVGAALGFVADRFWLKKEKKDFLKKHLRKIIPANLLLDVVLKTNTYGDLEVMTYGQMTDLGWTYGQIPFEDLTPYREK